MLSSRLRIFTGYILIFTLSTNPLVASAQRISRMDIVVEEVRTMQHKRNRVALEQRIAEQLSAKLASNDAISALAQRNFILAQNTTAGQFPLFNLSTGIEIDAAALIANQLSLKESANGTLVVDIAEASAAGVSHNLFSTFNVSESGLILNNSQTPLISVLGGWTDGNRRLAGGTAKIILAEVNGGSASSLLGYTEILGDSAEFVLANANGITCNGCGFINTPRVIFATGTADMKNGALQGFNIAQGKVFFDGLGMNASNVSQFDILTRAMFVNAAIYADQLNIFTGANYYDYKTGEAKPLSEQTLGLAPLFSLDVSALGGMYANSIRLLGTEAGLGVRSKGLINAVNDLELTADGSLILKDTLANETLKLTSITGDITTTGSTFSANVDINTSAQLNNQGTLAAGDVLNITAGQLTQSGDIYAGLNSGGELQADAILSIDVSGILTNQGNIVNVSGVDLTAGELSNEENAVIQSDLVNIEAEKLVNHGELSGSSVNLSGGSVVNSGNLQAGIMNLTVDTFIAEQGTVYQYGEDGALSFNGQSITLNGGLLITEGKSTFNAEQSIVNHGDWLAQGQLELITTDFSNSGTLEVEGLSEFRVSNLNNSGNLLFINEKSPELTITERLNNDSGLLQFSSENMVLNARSLTNDNGQINHLGTGVLSLTLTENLDNTQGLILASELNLTGQQIINQGGEIQGDFVTLSANQLTNEQGLILAFDQQSNSLNLQISDTLDNSQGTIQSASHNLDISTNNLINQQGNIIHSGSGVLALQANNLINELGGVWSENQVKIEADQLTNTSGNIVSQLIEINALALNNDSGHIQASAGMKINVTQIDNLNGQISSEKALTLSGKLLNNEKGLIDAGTKLTVNVSDSLINYGQISANNLTINTNELINYAGYIHAEQQLEITGTTLTNHGEGIIDGTTVAINATHVNNATSGVIQGQILQFISSEIINDGLLLASDQQSNALLIQTNTLINSGRIESHGQDFTLVDLILNNSGGELAHYGSGVFQIDSNQVLNNDHGIIFAQGQMNLALAALNNLSGEITAGQQLNVSATLVNNKQGLIQSGSNLIIAADTLKNQSGSVINHGGSNSQLNITNDIHNEQGLIEFGSDQANINVGTLTNAGGSITALGANLVIDSNIIENGEKGQITALQTLTLNSQTVDSAGIINAQNLVIATGNLINSGDLQAQTLQIDAFDVSNSGNILSQNATISTGVLVNSGVLQVLANGGVLDGIGGQLVITTKTLINSGTILTDSENFTLANLLLDNSNGIITHLGQGVLTIDAQNTLINQSGSIRTSGALILNAEALDNSQGLIEVAQQAEINLNNLTNEAGQLVLLGQSDLVLNIVETLNNNGGLIAANSNAMVINAAALENTGGEIQSTGKLIITTPELSNLEGKIKAGQLSIFTDVLNNDSGQIVALAENLAALQLDIATTLDNHNGLIYSNGTGALISALTLNNQDGEIFFAGDASISTQVLNNAGEGQITSAADLVLNTSELVNQGSISSDGLLINADNIDNSGYIQALAQAPESLVINSPILINSGVIYSQGENFTLAQMLLDNSAGSLIHAGTGVFTLDVLQTLKNSQGEIIGGGLLHIASEALDNQLGTIQSSNNLNIIVNSIDNREGVLSSAMLLDINSAQIDNSLGTLTAGQLTIDAVNLNNRQGILLASADSGQGIDLTIADTFNNALGNLQVAGQSGVINATTINNSDGSITLVGDGQLDINSNTLNNLAGGKIAANGQLVINVEDLKSQGMISAEQLSLVATTINQSGSVVAGSALTISAESLDNQGSIAADLISLSLTTLNNSGSISATGSHDESLVLQLNTLNNSGTLLSNGLALNLKQMTIDNTGGTIAHFGQGVLTLETQNELINLGGIIAAQGALSLTATEVNNEQGLIQVGQHADITTNIFNNLDGEIALLAEQLLSLSVTELLDNNRGRIAGGQLNISAENINNNAGSIEAFNTLGQGLSLAVTEQLSNIDGNIYLAAEQGSINAANLLNQGGTISHSGEQGLQLDIDTLDNSSGVIATNGQLTINGNELTNNGTILSQGSMALTFNTLLNLSDASISADGLTLAVNTLTNNGLIQGGDTQITSTTIVNQGQLVIDGTLALTSQLFDNSNGLLQVSQNTDISTVDFNNAAGQLVVTGDELVMNIANTLDNTNGVIATNALTNQLTTTTLLNNQGTLKFLNDLDVKANSLVNLQGEIAANNQLLTVGHLDNSQGGKIVAANSLNINTQELNSDGLLAATQLTLNSDSFTQAQNAQLTADNANISVTELNNSGEITANELSLLATNITNAGTLAATESLALTAENLTNIDGVINSNGQLVVAVDNLLNQQGKIYSENLTLTADTLTNRQGEIAAFATSGQSLNIAITNTLDNQGVIYADGDSATIKATTLNNNGDINFVGNGLLTLTTLLLNNLNNGTIGSISALFLDSPEINNSGELQANIVTITGENLTNAGKIQAGMLTVNADTLNNSGLIETEQANISLDSLTNSGQILAAGLQQKSLAFNLNALNNTGVIATNGTDFILSGLQLDNNNGQIMHYGQGVFTLDTLDTLSNQGGLLLSEGQLALSVDTLDNSQGEIVAKQLNINLNLSNSQLNNAQGSLIASEHLTITAGDVNNNLGEILALGESGESLQLNITGALDNQQGTIYGAGEQATITANTLDNRGGIINHSGSDLLTITAASINNSLDTTNAGANISTIAGNGNLIINSEQLLTAGSISSREVILNSDVLDNQGNIDAQSLIISTNTLSNSGNIVAETVLLTGATNNLVNHVNNSGNIVARSTLGQSLKVLTDNLTNSGALISYGEDLFLTGLTLDNQGGEIAHLGEGVFTLDTLTELKNQSGQLLTEGQLVLNTALLTNASGLIQADNGMTIKVQNFNNQQGQLLVFAEQALALTASDTINNQAGVIGAQILTLNSKVLDNTAYNGVGGQILAKDVRLTAESVDNSDGVIVADTLNFFADSLVNNLGTLVANKSFAMTISGLLDNSQGQIVTTAVGAYITAGSIKNAQGLISQQGSASNESLSLTVANGLSNTLGEITSAQQLQINASTVDNQGVIDANTVNITGNTISNQGTIQGEKLVLNADSIDNSGLILSTGTNGQSLNVTTVSGTTNTGQIQSHGQTLLFAQALDNSQGSLVHTGNGLLSFSQLVNKQGLVYALGDLAITGGDLNNQSGVLQVTGSASFMLDNLNNSNGEISTFGQKTNFKIAQTLTNAAGKIIADNQTLLIEASDIINGSGVIASSNNLQLTADSISSSAGLLRAENSLTMKTESLSNNNNAVISAANIDITSVTSNNQNGVIESTNSMLLTLANINNQQGLILSGGDNFSLVLSGLFDNRAAGELEVHSTNWTINEQNINNQGGTLRHMGSGELLIASAEQLNNQAGMIASLGDVTLNLSGTNLSSADNNQALNNQQGIIQASGNLTITTPNDINNSSGVLLAEGAMAINGADLANTGGQLLSASGTTLTLSGELANNNGLIYNQNGNLRLSADKLSNGNGVILQQGSGTLALNLNTFSSNGEISGNAVNINAATVNNAGIIQGSNLVVNANQLSNSGTMAGELLTLNASYVDNSGGVLYASGVQGESLIINSANQINNHSGMIQSLGSALNFTNGINNNQGEILLLSSGTLSANNIINTQGTLLSAGDINLSGSLDNQAGKIEAAKALNINSAALLNNNGGSLFAGAELNIVTNGLTNRGGRIVGTGSVYRINSSGDIDNSIAGLLASSANDMNISGSSLNNTQGSIVHQGNGNLALSGFDSLNNNGGTLATGGIISLLLNSLTNDSANGRQGIISAKTANLTINELSNQGGVIQAQTLNINSNNVNNNGGLILGQSTANNSLVLAVSGGLTNNGGIIESRGTNLDLSNINQINNNNGQIRHLGSGVLKIAQQGTFDNSNGGLITQGSLSLNSGTVLNDNGLISSQGSQSITAASLSTSGGRIESAANLTLDVNGAVNNSGGSIVTGGVLALSANGALTNSKGIVFAGSNANIDAGSVNNNGGTLASNGQLNIDAGTSLTNSGGVIQSDNVLQLTANTISNRSGLMQAQSVTLHSSNILDNSGGSISGSTVTLRGSSLNNSSGTVLATGSGNNSLNLSGVSSINNTNGTLATFAQNWALSLNSISNSGGNLIHKGSGSFNVSKSGTLVNSGTLASNGNLVLAASSVDNRGQLQAGSQLTINAGLTNSGVLAANNITVNGGNAVISNSGQISASGTLALTGGSVSNSNLLYSAGSISINAGTVTNTGTLSANDLNVSGFSNLNNSGRIESVSGSYNGSQLSNVGSGVLIASGTSANSMKLNVNQLNNKGTIYNKSSNMSFAGSVTNSGLLVHAGSGTLTLGDNGSLDIDGGSISTAGSASLKGNISGSGDVYAKKGMSIDTSGTFVNTNSRLYTGGNLQINSAVNNQGGELIADGTLGINTTGTVNNSNGTLQGNNINIIAGAVNNNSGTITSTGSGSGQIIASSINNTNGTIASQNSSFTLKTTSGNINNNGGTIKHSGSGTLTVDSKGSIGQSNGVIHSSGALVMKAGGSINNEGGDIQADKFDVTAGNWFSNVGGKLLGTATGNSALSASSINNTNGTITNDGSSLLISSTGALNNSNGSILSVGTGVLDINASSIKNNGGSSYILANGSIDISGGSKLTNSGIISAATSLKTVASNITNSGTMASRGGAADIDVSGTLTNTGMISGKTTLDINTRSMKNAGGSLQSDGSLTLDTNSLILGQIFGGNLNIITRGALTLGSSDKLSASGNLVLNTNGKNITNQGRILSSGSTTISGGKLTNSGSIKAGGSSQLNFNSITNSGVLSSNTTLTVNLSGADSKNSGTFSAGNTLDINGSINNTNLLFAGSNLTIDGTIINNSSIYSAGNASLTGNITNNGGTISAAGNLSLSGTINNNRSIGSTQSFTEGVTTVTTSGDSKPRFNLANGFGTKSFKTEYVTKITTSTTVFNASVSGTAGVIAAGGNLSLSGTTINKYSTISANGQIIVSGNSVLNKTVQNQTKSEVTVSKEKWIGYCLVGVVGRNCAEPGEWSKASEEVTDTYEETKLIGGAYGTIAARLGITGSLSGQLEVNSLSPAGLGSRSANTSASGSSGSANRGNSASGNANNANSVSTTNGSSQSTVGQNRSASGTKGSANSNVSVAAQNQQQNFNGDNSQSNLATTDVIVINGGGVAERATDNVAATGQTFNNNEQASGTSGVQQSANYNGNGVLQNASTVKQGTQGSSNLADNGYKQSEVNDIEAVNTINIAGADQQNQGAAANVLTASTTKDISKQSGSNIAIYQQVVSEETAVVTQGNNYDSLTAAQRASGRYSEGAASGTDGVAFEFVDDSPDLVAANDPRFTSSGESTSAQELDTSMPAKLSDGTRVLNMQNPDVRQTGGAGGTLSNGSLKDQNLDYITSTTSQPTDTPIMQEAQQVDVQASNLVAVAGNEIMLQVGGIAVNKANSDHTYQQENREEYMTEAALLGSANFLETIGHNPDEVLRTLVDNEQGLASVRTKGQPMSAAEALIFAATQNAYQLNTLAEMEAAADTAAREQASSTSNNNNLQVGENVFLTDAQLRVLTQDLGFDEDALNNNQQSLYAAIELNDLMADGVTISAGTFIDIRADGGIILETGIGGVDGVILRTEGELLTTETAFFDTETLIGLELGGDFTNTLDLSAQSLQISVGGDFINNGDLTAGSNLSLSSGNDFTNNSNLFSGGLLSINAGGDLLNQQASISGNDVFLNAGGDIINRTEFSQTTTEREHKRGTDSRTYTRVGQASTITSTNSLSMNAGNNIDLQGSELSAAGDISLYAANDVLLGAIEKKSGQEEYFKGGYNINYDTTYDVTTLQAGGNLSVVAGNNLESEGALFAANGNVSLAAGNEMNLLAVTESHLSSTKKTKKKTFSKKVTITESQHDTVQGTTVLAGGEILINALRNEDGSLSVQQTGDVNIIGATLQSGSDSSQLNSDIVIAGNDINILAQSYTDYEMKSVSKKSFGGLKSKANLDAEKTQKLSSSQIASGGDLTLLAGDDIVIGGSELFAQNDINVVVFDELLIAAGEETSQVESMSKKGGFLSGGSFYSSKEKMQGETATTAYASLLDAQGNINIDAGSATVIGSDVITAGELNVRTDIGDIEILAAQETVETYSSETKIDVGFGGALESMTNPTDMIKVEDGQLKISIGSATYDKVEFSSTSNTQRGSNIVAGGSATFESIGDILIEGSNIVADANGDADPESGLEGSVNFLAGNNVIIRETEETYEETLKELHGSAEVSVVVQHEAVEMAKSVLALNEAKESVKEANKEYKIYKQERAGLEGQLAQLEAQYESGAAGVTYTDLIELRELVQDVQDDEDWYVAGVALAVADATMKTVNIAKQVITASSSATTWGFNAGVQFDVDVTETTDTYEETTSVASNISGNNINIFTGLNDRANGLENTSTTVIQGSNLNANNNLNIDTGVLDILASRDTSSSTSEMQNGHLTIAQTVWGFASGGPSVNASYNRNESKDKTTTYNNSSLNANNISLTSAGDTNIQGGNIAAINDLNMSVGGDLIVESMQNRASGSNKGFGISAGFSFNPGENSEYNDGGAGDGTSGGQGNAYGNAVSALSDATGLSGVLTETSNNGPTSTQLGDLTGGVGSVNGGLNASSGRYQTRETVLSSITGGGEVNIDVAGNTNVVGALIAAIDSEGNDTGNLNLSTGSISFTDLTNTSYNSQQNAGLNVNVNVNSVPSAQGTGQGGSTQGAGTQNSNSDATPSSSLDIGSSQYIYSNSSSYEKGKTLATIGQGNVTVGGEALGEGETADLNINRDVDNIDTEQFSIDRQQGNIDFTADHEQVAIAAEVTGEVIQKIDVILPSATNDNAILAGMGSVLDMASTVTLGVIPSDSTNGGLIAQVPILLGADDIQHEIIGDLDSNNVFMPGILNTLEDAQAGADNIIGADTDKMVWLNPTHGLLGDLLESAVDLLGNPIGIQTGISQQAQAFQENNTGYNIFLHSQAHLISQVGADPDNNTYYSFGAPMFESRLEAVFGNSLGDLSIQKNDGDYVANPINIFNPSTWSQPGHGTENYGAAMAQRMAEIRKLVGNTENIPPVVDNTITSEGD